MSTTILDSDQTVHSVRVGFATEDGRTFFMSVSERGLEFYSERNSAGNFGGNPIVKSPDQILSWIAGEGAKKPFIERTGLQKRRAK